ncbi:MAG: hypothetical protein H6657_08795 [Ardenticatenaceae bacterium]|nr:hypothetical protein [Ardenticatenaceae bacterium]
MRHLPESDWKKLRPIREKALARLCMRTLMQIHAKSEPVHFEEAHKAYLEVYKLVDESDELVADLFNDWRRSIAIIRLMGWLSHGLVTEEEFCLLSQETQTLMTETVDIKFHP